METKRRIQKIISNSTEGLDAIIVKNNDDPYIDKNFFYITGISMGLFEGAALILYPDQSVELIIPQLEEEIASKTKLPFQIFKDKKEFNTIFHKICSSFRKIGINYKNTTYSDMQKLKHILPDANFIDVSNAFINARMIKDKLEIEYIKKACKIAENVMNKIPALLHEGVFEYELAAEINYQLQKNGADNPSFKTISAFAKNSAEPHYTHGNIKLKSGNFALFDFGAQYRQYNSDITRTFVYGKATEIQKEIYDVVFNAQKIGFEIIKPGILAHEVHDAVFNYIEKTKFRGRFIHSTGHSLGLDVHDSGISLTSDSNTPLKENMVLTIEPGIYLPALGGVRIEDDVLITKKGIEILTNSPRNLCDI